MPVQAYTQPLLAVAIDGEVVLWADRAPITGSFTPEAILESLGPLRAAAEKALQHRAQMSAVTADGSPLAV